MSGPSPARATYLAPDVIDEDTEQRVLDIASGWAAFEDAEISEPPC